MEDNDDKAALEAEIRASERLIACLFASLDAQKYAALKELLLSQTRFPDPATPANAIEIPEVYRLFRRVRSWSEST